MYMVVVVVIIFVKSVILSVYIVTDFCFKNSMELSIDHFSVIILIRNNRCTVGNIYDTLLNCSNANMNLHLL